MLLVCAALCAILSSCSQLQTGAESASLAIDSRTLMARSALTNESPSTNATFVVDIFYDGEYHTTKKTATLSQLLTETHKIENIPIGKTVDIYCDIRIVPATGVASYYCWGKAEGVEITSAKQDVTIQMNDAITTFTSADYLVGGVLTIPYGVTYIGQNSGINNDAITTVIIPRTVTGIDGTTFASLTNLQKVIFKDTRGWEISENGTISTIDVSDPAKNASNFTSNSYWMNDYIYLQKR